MFCQSLSKVLGSFCEYEPHRRLRELDPYEHLRRFFRICITHFKRNIHDIGTHVSPGVKAAMLSLASSEPHPDLEGAFKIIENGGSKAKGDHFADSLMKTNVFNLAAWLNDKRVTNKFAIPALYQPASLIPLGVWRASPSTTNGNEQAHRNINRDGVNLTVLGGIMRGMQYDHRAAASLDLHATQGIYNRDQLATHFHRLGRSVNRHGLSNVLYYFVVFVAKKSRPSHRSALNTLPKESRTCKKEEEKKPSAAPSTFDVDSARS